jgi:hypothetical protein
VHIRRALKNLLECEIHSTRTTKDDLVVIDYLLHVETSRISRNCESVVYDSSRWYKSTKGPTQRHKQLFCLDIILRTQINLES